MHYAKCEARIHPPIDFQTFWAGAATIQTLIEKSKQIISRGDEVLNQYRRVFVPFDSDTLESIPDGSTTSLILDGVPVAVIREIDIREGITGQQFASIWHTSTTPERIKFLNDYATFLAMQSALFFTLYEDTSWLQNDDLTFAEHAPHSDDIVRYFDIDVNMRINDLEDNRLFGRALGSPRFSGFPRKYTRELARDLSSDTAEAFFAEWQHSETPLAESVDGTLVPLITQPKKQTFSTPALWMPALAPILSVADFEANGFATWQWYIRAAVLANLSTLKKKQLRKKVYPPSLQTLALDQLDAQGSIYAARFRNFTRQAQQ